MHSFCWPDGHSLPTTIVAVDQTGAVNSKGTGKPLCTAVFDYGSARLNTNVRLAALNSAAVSKVVPASSPRVLVLVDAVLGLPDALGISFESLLKSAGAFKWNGKALGREVAAQFFRGYLSSAAIPARLAELLAGANSVFLEHPFQRNIGCGTFRILKDLAAEERWFSLWPRDEISRHRFVLAEGYPSLCWRQWLCAPKRDLSLLEAHLREHHPHSALPLTTDDGDAIALALAAVHFLDNGALNPGCLPARAFREGWIFGLEPKKGTKQQKKVPKKAKKVPSYFSAEK